MPTNGKGKFEAEKVVALKMQNKARRLELKFSDSGGIEHVVSLPIPAALELARLISDACSFMTKLKRGARSSKT